MNEWISVKSSTVGNKCWNTPQIVAEYRDTLVPVLRHAADSQCNFRTANTFILPHQYIRVLQSMTYNMTFTYYDLWFHFAFCPFSYYRSHFSLKNLNCPISPVLFYHLFIECRHMHICKTYYGTHVEGREQLHELVHSSSMGPDRSKAGPKMAVLLTMS